jgi:hypothetical protein
MRGLPDLAGIEVLQRKIERWRRERPKSRSMPEELWREATGAPDSWALAHVLGLGYEGPRKRVLA